MKIERFEEIKARVENYVILWILDGNSFHFSMVPVVKFIFLIVWREIQKMGQGLNLAAFYKCLPSSASVSWEWDWS